MSHQAYCQVTHLYSTSKIDRSSLIHVFTVQFTTITMGCKDCFKNRFLLLLILVLRSTQRMLIQNHGRAKQILTKQGRGGGGGVAIFDFSAAAMRVSWCAFLSPSSPKVRGTAAHAFSSLAWTPDCATSLPTSLMLVGEVDAKKKKVWFNLGSAAPRFKITWDEWFWLP